MPSQLWYYTGGSWVQETRMFSLTMIDEVNHPFVIQAVISDPRNTRNDVYTSGLPLKIIELTGVVESTNDIIWQGTVQFAETSNSKDGQIITVTGVDDLAEISETDLNCDLGASTDMTSIFTALVSAATYHTVAYGATLVGTPHAGLWLKGQTSGVRAQVACNLPASSSISVRNLERTAGFSDFQVGEVVKEYMLETCSSLDLLLHDLFYKPVHFTVSTVGGGRVTASVEAGLLPSGLSAGPNLLGAGQSGLDFLLDSLEFTKSAAGTRYGCIMQCKRRIDNYSYLDIFHRDAYTGMLASSLAQYNGGTDPADPVNFGLTIAYGESDPANDRWIKMLDDYNFGYPNPKEMSTRVVCHYAGVDQSGQEAIASNASVESALGRAREYHTYAYWITDGTIASALATNVAAQMDNASGIFRGSCSIAKWPQFKIGGTRYFVRAGHTVCIHNTLITPILPAANKSMIVRKITYTEPACIATLEFIDNYYGILGSFSLSVPDMLRRSRYEVKKQAFQTLARSGLNNDKEPPSQPFDIMYGTAPTLTQCIGGISIEWVFGLEADLKYYKVYRDTDPAMATETLIGKVAANTFVDLGLKGGVKLTNYYYRIYAVDMAGNVSDPSVIAGPLKYGDSDIERIYPVGGLYFSTTVTDPATQLGFGTWAQFGAGKAIVGHWAGGDPDGDYDAIEGTGGAKTVTLTVAKIPAHKHTHAAHTHTITHTHTLSAHTHTTASHTHGLGTHTHTVAAHSHTLGTHTHTHSHYHTTGSHAHTIDPPSTGTSAVGDHAHSVGPVAGSGHAQVGTVGADTHYMFDAGYIVSWTGYAGGHSHSVDITAFSSAGSGALNTGDAIGVWSSGPYGGSDSSGPFTSSGPTGISDGSGALASGIASPNSTGAASPGDTGSTTSTETDTGGGEAHQNLSPYIVVYIWKRTA